MSSQEPYETKDEYLDRQRHERYRAQETREIGYLRSGLAQPPQEARGIGGILADLRAAQKPKNALGVILREVCNKSLRSDELGELYRSNTQLVTSNLQQSIPFASVS